MSTAATTFLASLGPEREARALDGVDVVEVDRRLTALHDEATAAWAPVVVDAVVFARHLGACVAADPEDRPPLDALAALYARDLFLARAAGDGDQAAIALVVQQFIQPAARALGPLGRGVESTDEVCQILHERLLMPGGDDAPRILRYEGRAPLGAWVGIAARRVMLESMRADGARRRMLERAASEPNPGVRDPELDYLKSTYKDAFEAAVAGAIEALAPRLRAVLRLYVVGELPLARIGEMFGVDESTASRWVKRARDEIREEAKRRLIAAAGVAPHEVASIVRLVESQVHVSVARLLAAADLPVTAD